MSSASRLSEQIATEPEAVYAAPMTDESREGEALAKEVCELR